MAKSIFDIYNSSASLDNHIQKLASPLYKITAITKFFSQTLLNPKRNDNYRKYYSFYLQYLPKYLKLIMKNEFSCISPDAIEEIITVLNTIKVLGSFGSKQVELDEALKTLYEIKDNALKMLADEHKLQRAYSPNSMNIVLIEKSGDFIQDFQIESGVIHKLNLDTKPLSKNASIDIVKFSSNFQKNDVEILEYLKKVVCLAKEEYKKTGAEASVYEFNFYFDNENYFYTGKSLGLAAICLVYNSILIDELENLFYFFLEDTVFSAEIDSEGNLCRLDESCLKIKIQTVFYSKYRKFVIPEDNLSSAKKILARLNEKYPQRVLQLIPVKNFNGVFKNLDIVEQHKLTKTAKLKKYFEIYKTQTVTILFIAVLLFIVLITRLYILPFIDNNPESFEMNNSRYHLLNKYGREIWESEKMTDFNQSIFESYKSDQLRCILTDLNYDGKNELYYLNRNDAELEKSRLIFCSDAKVMGFPFKLEETRLKYNEEDFDFSIWLKGISLIDINKDGKNEMLYYGTHMTYYPSVLGIIDNNGKDLSHYWHEGMPFIVEVFDIDDDGIQEVFWGGCNNRNDSIECAAMVVFDPRFISGSSPYTDPTGDGKKGLEKYYVLFPRTFILESTGRERNDVHSIQKKAGGKITVMTNEFLSDNFNIGSLIYDFDNEMNLIGIGENDFFKNRYNKMRDSLNILNKSIPELSDYEKELAKRVRWWDGEKFVKTTVINKSYLEAVNKK